MKETLDQGYIDIHNHVLYDVDDGSRSLEMSMDMLACAYEDGIRGMILTPHYHPEKTKADEETIKMRFEELKSLAHHKFPDMKLYRGYEIYCAMDILEELEQYNWENPQEWCAQGKRNPGMAGSRYLLMEYSPSVHYEFIRTSVNRMVQAGWNPILAHVERYVCLVQDWEKMGELIETGAFIQVNASTVTGDAGSSLKKYVKRLMQEDWVDFIATDAHSMGHRKPQLRACARYMSKKYGADYARRLLIENPQSIIQEEYLEE